MAVQQQLHDEALLLLAQHWLDRPDDPGLAADLDPLTNLERLGTFEAARRNDGVALPKLLPVLRHRLLQRSGADPDY